MLTFTEEEASGVVSMLFNTKKRLQRGSTGNFGANIRMLKGPMIEQRLARLLECDSIEYFVQYLMEFAQALSNAGLPVNPHSLQRDLAHWGKEAQIEWAAAFWQGTE